MTRNEMMNNVVGGLGAIVWHDLEGTRITPDRLRTILSAEGIDPTIVPDIDPESAVRRAVGGWRYGAGEFRAVVGFEDDAEVVINIVRKQQTATRKKEFLHYDSVVFDKNTGSLSSPQSEEATSFVRKAEEMIETLDHSWIRPNLILARMKEMGACSLRRQGGVYYVPKQHRADLDKLARIVSQIGNSVLNISDASSTAASQQSIGRSAQRSIGDKVSEIVSKLTKWKESARKASGPALASALAELADLRKRAELYSDALSIAVEDLDQGVTEAIELAREVIEQQDEVLASPIVVEALTGLLAAIEPSEDGCTWISQEAAKDAGLSNTKTYSYWRGGVGAASAAEIGFISALRKGPEGEPCIVLTPKPTTPSDDDSDEERSEEPSEVSEETEVSGEEVDPEDAAADARERLAQKTEAQVATIFESVLGTAPAALATKAEMIEEVVASIG